MVGACLFHNVFLASTPRGGSQVPWFPGAILMRLDCQLGCARAAHRYVHLPLPVWLSLPRTEWPREAAAPPASSLDGFRIGFRWAEG